jgi:hypothetical protein
VLGATSGKMRICSTSETIGCVRSIRKNSQGITTQIIGKIGNSMLGTTIRRTKKITKNMLGPTTIVTGKLY